MTSNWKIWTNTKEERKARLLLHRVLREMEREAQSIRVDVEDEHLCSVYFDIEHEEKPWPEFVVEVITLGHCVGYGWYLTGIITLQAEAISNDTRISGVEAVSWYFEKGSAV